MTDTALRKLLGERLRYKRHAEASTLCDISLHTGLSVSLISQVERGRWGSIPTYHKLCAALDMPLAELFRGV